MARMDGDDEWLPHKLKTQVAMLEANKNLVLVGGGAEIINQDSVPTGFIFNVAIDGTAIKRLLLYHRTDCGVRRTIL